MDEDDSVRGVITGMWNGGMDLLRLTAWFCVAWLGLYVSYKVAGWYVRLIDYLLACL